MRDRVALMESCHSGLTARQKRFLLRPKPFLSDTLTGERSATTQGDPVTDRTRLDFNFIDLVMSVSGRVRPLDLQQIPEPARVGLMQAYYEANAHATPLHFEGDVLVKGAGAAPEPMPTTILEPYAPGESPYAAVSAPDAPAAAPVAPAVPVPDILAPAPVAPAAGLEPAPVPPADFAAPALAPEQVPAPSESDFFSIPPGTVSGPDPIAETEAVAPAAAVAPASGNVSFLFWLLPVLFAFVGGIAAFFLVRTKNPKLARIMLITGIVMTLVLAALGAAAFFTLPKP